MKNQRLDQQVEFCREIDKEKMIKRQTYLTDAATKENDAEHAWHMAVMTLILSEYANEEIDVLKTISMLLIHDIVEIDAGDTFAYDEEAKESQALREEAAADRIFGILPSDQQDKFRSLWDEFEEGKTPEARFARSMDNFQPIMLNASVGGKGWSDWGTPLSKILKRNENSGKGSQTLWDYSLENFIMPHVENGVIKKDL